MSGNWLVLETSGRVGQVGLARQGVVVHAAALDDRRRHARDLAPTADDLLRAEGLAPRDLTGVVVGRGPGSYTGLRVGLISAKALAYALGCELRAVDTFAAIAEQAPAEAREVWVMADALQNQVYVQCFERVQDRRRPVQPLRISSIEEALWLIAPGAWVTGPGVPVYSDRIPQTSRLVPEADREPRLENVYTVGMRTAPLSREEVFALEPLYLRESSAEEKARGK